MKLLSVVLGSTLLGFTRSQLAKASVCGATSPTPLYGFIGTGQSLSDGVGGVFETPDTQQNYGNLKLSDQAGLYALSNPNATSVVAVPLQEPIRPVAVNGSGTYPLNIYGQTPHHAMADQMSALAAFDGAACISAHTVVGEGGRSITSIEKNGTEADATASPAYAASLFEAQAFRRLAGLQNRTYGVGAVVLTHGETDAYLQNYSSAVMAMVYDYQRDLSAITGQTSRIPVLLSQQNTLGVGGDAASALNATTFSWSRYGQFKMATDYPLDAIVTGPKYQYTYWLDHLHLVQTSYRRLGEKYGQVAYETVVKGNPWLPTMPLFASLTDNKTVTIPYHAPVSPLQWDTGLPSPHAAGSPWALWALGRGFELFHGNATPAPIEAVSILPNNVVQIKSTEALSGIPRVQYAMTQDAATGLPQGNLGTGAIGQLTDSDPMVGIDKARYACAVQANSSLVQCDNTVLDHEVGDTVLDSAGQTVGRLQSRSSNASFILDRRYAGASGLQNLTFHFNQQNYAVASSQPVVFTSVANAALPSQWSRVGFGLDTGWQGVCSAFLHGRWLSGAAASDGLCRIAFANNVVAQTSYHLLSQLTPNAAWADATARAVVAPGALVSGLDGRRPTYACRVPLRSGGGAPVGQVMFDTTAASGLCQYARDGQVETSGTYQTLAMGDGLPLNA